MLKDTLNKGISTPIAIIIILVLVILVGGFTWWQYGEIRREISELPEIGFPEREEVKDETADWETYRNDKYRYEFLYPKDYIFKERVPSEHITLRKKGSWYIEVFTERDSKAEGYFDTSKMSFYEFAIDKIRSSCAGDSMAGSVYCTDIVKKETFKNEYGIEGYKIYITEVREDYTEEVTKKSEQIKGPIYVLNIAKQTNNLARLIFFQFTFEKENALEKEDLSNTLDQILSTFKFLD